MGFSLFYSTSCEGLLKVLFRAGYQTYKTSSCSSSLLNQNGSLTLSIEKDRKLELNFLIFSLNNVLFDEIVPNLNQHFDTIVVQLKLLPTKPLNALNLCIPTQHLTNEAEFEPNREKHPH